jgi:hypothetical protein
MVDLTLVTGILDIGRAALPSRFARPFESYRDALDQLLDLDVPMVVYADSTLGLATSRRTTRLVAVARADLERFPHFETIQRIRALPSWRGRAAWLPESPQALLPHYNPLVMSKLFWLAEQACTNPFGTSHFAWIDAGITLTVSADALQRSLRGERILHHLERFLFLCYPYTGASEIHGFERAALARYANVEHVEWVARGGFFGGRAEFVAEAARLYDVLLRHTLEHGYMGTEESVFTILALLHPGMFDRFALREDGLLTPFFDHVADGTA